MGGLGGSDVEEEEEEMVVMGGLPMRGDSGGGVSQPISDTGEPFLTYGVASRMYLTEKEKSGNSQGQAQLYDFYKLVLKLH